MRLFFILPLLGLALSVPAVADCATLPKAGPFLAYTIEPKLVDGSLSLEVLVSFRLTSTKTTELNLPSEWQGQKELYRAISNLEALSPGTTIQVVEKAWQRRLTFQPGQIVRLRYRVTKDWAGKINASSYLRVMLDQSYFQVAGRNFLVYPALPEDEEIPLFVEWKNMPPAWKVVDSFSGDFSCQFSKTYLIKLSNGLFAGGAIRLNKLDLEGKTVFVATRGQWDFTDGQLVDLVRRILTGERSFWHDPGAANYVLTLLPSDDAPGNYGGTALEDSFALFMGEGTRLDFQTKFLLAHEMFHTWNPGKLGEIHGENPFWFTEGFTDYYARTLLLRAGLISAEDYANDVDTAYREYKASRVLHAKGSEVQDRFFSDDDFQRLAYLRGNFLAQRWNFLIQERSKGKQSLDDAMLNLLHQAQSRELVLTTRFLSEHFSAYVGPDAARDIQRYIEEGETIPLAIAPSAPTAGHTR